MKKKRKKELRLPNNYGGIVFLGERRRKPYAARVTVGWSENRKQIYKYLGYFESKIEALECLVEYNKNPYDIDTQKITFFEVYEKWSNRHYEKISRQTVRNYKSQIKKFECFYNTPFCELKNNHYQQVIDSNSKANARLLKALLTNIYDYAIKNEIVQKDYSQSLDMPEVVRKEKQVFTLDEIDLLWKNEGDVYADMLLILLYSGMRVTELLTMKSENVHLNERYMIGGVKTKAGINRTIPIHKKIDPIIRRNIGSNFIFQGSQGGQYYYNVHGTRIKKYMKDLGIDHTIHETRHSFISQCDRLELNKVLTKTIVGHHTSDITDKYTHKHKQDVIDFIDKFFY